MVSAAQSRTFAVQSRRSGLRPALDVDSESRILSNDVPKIQLVPGLESQQAGAARAAGAAGPLRPLPATTADTSHGLRTRPLARRTQVAVSGFGEEAVASATRVEADKARSLIKNRLTELCHTDAPLSCRRRRTAPANGAQHCRRAGPTATIGQFDRLEPKRMGLHHHQDT